MSHQPDKTGSAPKRAFFEIPEPTQTRIGHRWDMDRTQDPDRTPHAGRTVGGISEAAAMQGHPPRAVNSQRYPFLHFLGANPGDLHVSGARKGP